MILNGIFAMATAKISRINHDRTSIGRGQMSSPLPVRIRLYFSECETVVVSSIGRLAECSKEYGMRSSLCLLLFLCSLATAAVAATPPVPSQASATCDAVIGGLCQVNGSFTLTTSSAGAHHYRVCRSNDTTGWGGCNVVMSTNSGPSYTVSGGDLPSEGFRRAYYFRACDALDNCSAYNQARYVAFDSTPPPVPSQASANCDAVIGGLCQVNGSFTLTTSSAGAHHYKVCRSKDTNGWGGCNVVMSTSSGPSYTVSGGNLPSEDFRRAYYFRACDALDNCSAYNQARYVAFDSTPPPVPSQASANCDAVIGGLCHVNGSFTLTTSSAGAHHYKVCRSNDTNGWGGCNVVMSTSSGPSYTVSGGNLPSEGFRRAYYFRACDALDNCSAYNQARYVAFDSTPPSPPDPVVASDCDAQNNNLCAVNGPFVLSTSGGPDVDRLRVCRSNDTTGWGGCNVLVSNDSGEEFVVSGSHLPSDGFRRAYYVQACDQVNNCTAWGTPVYVYGDDSLLQCPTLEGFPQPIAEPRACTRSSRTLSEPGLPTPRASDAAVHQALTESLVEYSLEILEPGEAREELEQSGWVTLRIDDQPRRLVLEPLDLRADSFVQLAADASGELVQAPEPISTYRGYVQGEAGSSVHLVVHPELVMGSVVLDGTRYFIDPAYRFEPGGGADRLVIYEEGKLRQESGVSCGMTDVARHSEELFGEDWRLGAGSSVITKGSLLEVEIATDADYEYYRAHQQSVSATNAHIRWILGMVDDFYDDVGLKFKVTQQRVFTTPSDPYETCNLILQWCEMYQEWERYRASVQRDVAYLFSGKDMFGRLGLSGTPFRIRGTSGFLGSVCAQPSRAYVISNIYREVGLVAHELGHAFGAIHDSFSLCSDSDCGGATCTDPTPNDGGPVMCGPIQNPVEPFSPRSVNDVTTFVNGSGGTCLSPAP
ncbi:MAG: M12 family metallo-peptidase [Acidobacteriota bacterium]